MLTFTPADYREIARIIDDKTFGLALDTKLTFEYDNDRFYSNVECSIILYSKSKNNPEIFIPRANIKTYLEEGECSNDFDVNRLRSEVSLLS